MVRCGRCNAIFKATEHLHGEEQSPERAPLIARANIEVSQIAAPNDTVSPEHFVATPTDSDELETLVQQIVSADEFPGDEFFKPVPKRRQWPWIVASSLLLLLAFAQALYFYRIEIASRLPGVKPALTGYCELLKCVIFLPEKIELLSIESSDLQADPLQPNVVTFSALLHNRAEYTQAYPSLELSLTDTEDQVLARRVFTPAEYLHANNDEKQGLGANRELNIQLHLDSGDLRPMGYKLLLFFSPKLP
jgi:hypothetical protein